MHKAMNILALLIIIASGYWMSLDKSISLGSFVLSSNWGSVGLALGACLMIISIKRKS